MKLVVFWQGCEPLYRHHLEFGRSKRHVFFPMLIYQRRIKRIYSNKKGEAQTPSFSRTSVYPLPFMLFLALSDWLCGQ